MTSVVTLKMIDENAAVSRSLTLCACVAAVVDRFPSRYAGCLVSPGSWVRAENLSRWEAMQSVDRTQSVTFQI